MFGLAGAPQPPPSVGVTVSPPSASLGAGQSQQFSAVVSGTGNQAVTWSRTPAVGDPHFLGVIYGTFPCDRNPGRDGFGHFGGGSG